MAQCSQCKAETQLHINGVPVCPGCDDARSKKIDNKPDLEAPDSQGAFGTSFTRSQGA
jgi:hypothetical protein